MQCISSGPFVDQGAENESYKVLTQLDPGFMKNLGYGRRVAAPPGLDPPYFSCWVRVD